MNNFCTLTVSAAPKAIMLLLAVLAISWIGVLIMQAVTGHRYVTEQLKERASRENRRQLNLRLWGYNADKVGQHWEELDARALTIERRFLLVDLAFPLIYGSAFIFALWQEWADLSRVTPVVWIFVPVAVTVFADWIENIVQLAQLRRFTEYGKAGLEPGWIHVASLATTTKWLFFAGTSLLLLALPVCAS